MSPILSTYHTDTTFLNALPWPLFDVNYMFQHSNPAFLMSYLLILDYITHKPPLPPTKATLSSINGRLFLSFPVLEPQDMYLNSYLSMVRIENALGMFLTLCLPIFVILPTTLAPHTTTMNFASLRKPCHSWHILNNSFGETKIQRIWKRRVYFWLYEVWRGTWATVFDWGICGGFEGSGI